MIKKRRRRKGIQSYAEEFALSLMFEATNGKVGRIRKSDDSEKEEANPISFRDKAKLLDSITKLVGAQSPSEDDDEDGIQTLRERLNDGNSGEAERGADSPDEI